MFQVPVRVSRIQIMRSLHRATHGLHMMHMRNVPVRNLISALRGAGGDARGSAPPGRDLLWRPAGGLCAAAAWLQRVVLASGAPSIAVAARTHLLGIVPFSFACRHHMSFLLCAAGDPWADVRDAGACLFRFQAALCSASPASCCLSNIWRLMTVLLRHPCCPVSF